MAGAFSAPPCLIRPFTSRKSLLLVSSVITPRPRKLTKRKNYLRPKILKTLTKPYIIPLTEPLVTPLETPIKHTHIFPTDDDELKVPENQQLRLPGIVDSADLSDFTEMTFPETPFQQDRLFPSNLETSENQEIMLSDSAGVVHDGSGTFGKSLLLKYGLWLVGAFVFQTFCAVWVLGSADYSRKNGSSGYNNEILELDSKSKHKIRMFVNGDGKQSVENGGIVLVDETEMEKKIGEIQHMAREARKKERLESKATKFDEEHEDEVEDSDVKIGIKKEVDERLIKLRKGLGKVRSKQPTNSVAHPKVDSKKNDTDDDDDKLDEKELNAALIFKRKNKSRDFASKPSNKPKGFMARDHQSVKKNSLEKRGMKKQGDSEESEAGTYISANRNNGNSLLEAVELKESSIEETATISNAGSTLVDVVDPKEASSMKSATTLDRRNNSYRNGISRRNVAKDQKVVKPNGGTESRNDSDFWWFSLPYVLAIRMRRGEADEGPEGLFALKSEVNGRLSHTVAFEDRGDATNFCYLLQSFFEDLGDFTAEIVPFPVKELSEAIRSHAMKVIVVKKGKLKLYAGQPLAEAEMALRSLTE